jgi:hypothetical protein
VPEDEDGRAAGAAPLGKQRHGRVRGIAPADAGRHAQRTHVVQNRRGLGARQNGVALPGLRGDLKIQTVEQGVVFA